jgi:hypothetical protein
MGITLEVGKSGLDFRFRDTQFFANFHRGCLVTQAHYSNIHLCSPTNVAQATKIIDKDQCVMSLIVAI